MYIYEEGKKLINLDHILVIRIHSYTNEVDYVEFEGPTDTVAVISVPKGEGKYVLAGIRYILGNKMMGIYTKEELISFGKSIIEESDH
jgi:hypothetical protein